jgi:hypothetical protein
MIRRSLAPLAFLALLAVPGVASASKHGASVDISLPLQLLAGLGGTMTLNCDNDVDSDTRAMMQTLRRSGRYESRDGDDRFTAWRLGDRFRLKAVDGDGDGDGAFTLEMPWAAAECLFGGVTGKRQIKLESLERSGGFKLRMSGDDASIKVAVD